MKLKNDHWWYAQGFSVIWKEMAFILILVFLTLFCVMLTIDHEKREEEAYRVYEDIPLMLVPAHCAEWFD